MPVPPDSDLGPLAPLAGTWEGDQGLDVAYSNDEGKLLEIPYRERTVLNPFGPVDNGAQQLFGLDYRMAAWKETQEDPFHTEVGYWLWDAAANQVTKCFIIPRGSSIQAGGPATPGATSFQLTANVGSEIYGILSNQFLAKAARSTAYAVTITVGPDGSFAYTQTTSIEHARWPQMIAHTDRNVLHRVD
jgi:hypothetical protein